MFPTFEVLGLTNMVFSQSVALFVPETDPEPTAIRAPPFKVLIPDFALRNRFPFVKATFANL